MRDYPGDMSFSIIVHNETKGKTFETSYVDAAYERVDMEDYQLNDELMVYLINSDLKEQSLAKWCLSHVSIGV